MYSSVCMRRDHRPVEQRVFCIPSVPTRAQAARRSALKVPPRKKPVLQRLFKLMRPKGAAVLFCSSPELAQAEAGMKKCQVHENHVRWDMCTCNCKRRASTGGSHRVDATMLSARHGRHHNLVAKPVCDHNLFQLICLSRMISPTCSY